MNLHDKINLVVAFLNKDELIENDNIFLFNNVELVDTLYLHKDIFCTEKLQNIKIKNDHPLFSFVQKLGYSFRINSEYLDKIYFDEKNYCFLMASITKDCITLKANLIQDLIDEKYKELENKQKEILKLEQEINILTKIRV